MVKEFSKMSESEFRAAQDAISLFRLLGLTYEDIESLASILKAWPKTVETINRIIADQNEINEKYNAIRGELPSQRSGDSSYRQILESSGVATGSAGLGFLRRPEK